MSANYPKNFWSVPLALSPQGRGNNEMTDYIAAAHHPLSQGEGLLLALLFCVDFFFQHTDEWKVPVFLGEVESVSHDELIWHLEAH
jgi:hypothetical protein